MGAVRAAPRASPRGGRRGLVPAVCCSRALALRREGRAGLDTGRDKEGIRVTDEEPGGVRITRDEFHGEWNYTIAPKR